MNAGALDPLCSQTDMPRGVSSASQDPGKLTVKTDHLKYELDPHLALVEPMPLSSTEAQQNWGREMHLTILYFLS